MAIDNQPVLQRMVSQVQRDMVKVVIDWCDRPNKEQSVNTGKFKKSTIDAGNKKRDDLVRFKGDAKVIKSTVDLGKGNDTVRFGKAATFKGKTTIDLGKGGKDSIVIEADAVKGGKLVVTSFSKKDTITVGDETFTYKDIKNGASIPGVKVDLA